MITLIQIEPNIYIQNIYKYLLVIYRDKRRIYIYIYIDTKPMRLIF